MASIRKAAHQVVNKPEEIERDSPAEPDHHSGLYAFTIAESGGHYIIYTGYLIGFRDAFEMLYLLDEPDFPVGSFNERYATGAFFDCIAEIAGEKINRINASPPEIRDDELPSLPLTPSLPS